jgi:2-polyprenyl-3-methyl-5-hydroxy-6-metoxy-1,4-benzoquinol methylase
MKIDEILENIYEASKTPYPPTPERRKAQEEFLSRAIGFNKILDFCFGDGYTLEILRKLNPNAEIWGCSGNPLEFTDKLNKLRIIYSYATDMHKWLEYIGTPQFDMILARHVIEHSPMPFIILCLLNSKLLVGGKLFLVVPQDNLEMMKYKNHYSVLSKNLWEYLFKLAGFEISFFGEAQFQKSPNGLEWQYILNKINKPRFT